MEVGLGLRDIVLDGDPAPPPLKGGGARGSWLAPPPLKGGELAPQFFGHRDRDRDLPRFPRDRDETETFGNYVSRPSRDRDVEIKTASLGICPIHDDRHSFSVPVCNNCCSLLVY